MCPFSVNKSNSLKSTSEIDAVFKDGSKLSSKLISLYYAKSKEHSRLRFTFSEMAPLSVPSIITLEPDKFETITANEAPRAPQYA